MPLSVAGEYSCCSNVCAYRDVMPWRVSDAWTSCLLRSMMKHRDPGVGNDTEWMTSYLSRLECSCRISQTTRPGFV